MDNNSVRRHGRRSDGRVALWSTVVLILLAGVTYGASGGNVPFARGLCLLAGKASGRAATGDSVVTPGAPKLSISPPAATAVSGASRNAAGVPALLTAGSLRVREAFGTASVAVTPASAGAQPALLPVYRLYAPSLLDHLYTASAAEEQPVAAAGGYHLEGVIGYAPAATAPGAAPVFRLYNPRTGEHFYTASASERDVVNAVLGYAYEGVAFGVFTAPGPGLLPLYRLYSASWGRHFYTTVQTERDALVRSGGWNDEGILGYLSAAPAAPAAPVVSVVTAAPAAQPVTLPIEVMGADGTTASVQVAVPASAAVTGLWMQVHNLSYPDKASVQVNGGPWTPLDNATVQVAEPGKSYGGIGGGFSTLKMVLPLPVQAVQAGANTVSFRFNHTDGVSMGFRVLAFNFLTAQGQSVLPASAFVQDDPAAWRAPLSDAPDIAAGQSLWHNAVLVKSAVVSDAMLAHCSDCHTDDGRDLKYFNYSNYSIEQRSQFHGLSRTQGAQIASYIRTLNVPAPGRPWNPPYQPGPGLDSQPVQNWAAGAGLGAVLDKSGEVLPYVFPSTGGTPDASDIAASKDLNTRELPINLQLPDWNHWLPPVWPGDIPGSGFATSLALGRYDGSTPGYTGPTALSAAAQAQANPTQANLQNLAGNYLPEWLAQVQDLAISHAANPSESLGGPGIGAGSVPLTPETATEVYSVGLWGRVKEWGIMQKYGLEEMGRTLYGQTTRNGLPIENRVWFTGGTFQTSPSFLGIYGNDVGQSAAGQFAALGTPVNGINQNPLSLSPLVPGTAQLYQEIRVDWYWLQLILNDGDYSRNGNSPIDWGYFPGTVAGLGFTDGTDTGAMHYVTRVKMMQQYDNGVAPDQADPYVQGWDIRETNLGFLLNFGYPIWGTAPPTTAQLTALSSAYLAAWLPAAEQYAPAQYYAQGRLNSQDTQGTETTAFASRGDFESENAAQAMYHQVPMLDGLGVDPALMNTYVNWLQGLLPDVDFAHDR